MITLRTSTLELLLQFEDSPITFSTFLYVPAELRITRNVYWNLRVCPDDGALFDISHILNIHIALNGDTTTLTLIKTA